jgi:hypothetical protein
VITSNTSSMPEAGGDVSLYVDPSSRSELVNAMLEVRNPGHKADDCIKVRKQHAAQFLPEHTAEQLHATYKSLLK